MHVRGWALIAVVWTACSSSTPEVVAAPFVLGEAIVVLELGAKPPASVGDAKCTPGPWADARTVVLRCAPIADGPEGTQALAEALAALPGVRAAHPNMLREEIR